MFAFPPEWPEDLIPQIRAINDGPNTTLVVLDDDPTGTQTVYDIPVLADWSVEILTDELKAGTPLFYILTNSRALSEEGAIALTEEIGGNLLRASRQTGRKFRVVSRSDSTLRGHYPVEVRALVRATEMGDVKEIIMPFFFEGGRLTINDVHYVKDDEQLVPAADTPFAKDASFGYRNSDLKKWVEEKTAGKVKALEVESISLEDLRVEGPEKTADKILNATAMVFVVNAVTMRDAEAAALAFLLAEQKGARLVYRTAASIVQTLGGLYPRPLLSREELLAGNTGGTLIIAGSYVPMTTRQINHFIGSMPVHTSILDVNSLMTSGAEKIISELTRKTDEGLRDGKTTLLYTSRDVVTGADKTASLKINAHVSSCLVEIVRRLTSAPSCIIAKGGITSSDIATKALGVKKATVLGQVLPGVPVWRLGEESRSPGLPYIVFPGNVGGESSLTEVVRLISVRP